MRGQRVGVRRHVARVRQPQRNARSDAAQRLARVALQFTADRARGRAEVHDAQPLQRRRRASRRKRRVVAVEQAVTSEQLQRCQFPAGQSKKVRL